MWMTARAMTHSRSCPEPFGGLAGVAGRPLGCAYRPVGSLADLQTLDEGEVLDGYLSGVHGEEYPSVRPSRAFWHGWRSGMMDRGDLPPDAAALTLRREADGLRRRPI